MTLIEEIKIWWFRRKWLKIHSYMPDNRQKGKLLRCDLDLYQRTGRTPW